MNRKKSLEPFPPLTFRVLVTREQSQIWAIWEVGYGGDQSSEGEGLWVCYAALCWLSESLAGLILGLENLEDAFAHRWWGGVWGVVIYL